MSRNHAITPTDRAPKPDKDGFYRPEDWRRSNPGYERSPTRVSKCGKYVEVDGGSVWDVDQLGKTK